MKPDDSRPQSTPLQNAVFLLLVVAVTLAFFWIMSPFFGAILWGTVLAILFAPLHRRLAQKFHRNALGALATMGIILLLVFVPLVLVSISLANEATGLVAQIKSGQIDFARYFRDLQVALPAWATSALERVGLANLADVQARLSAGLVTGSQYVATQALSVGQNALDMTVSFFVMLYLVFFLLRDGDSLGAKIKRAIPMQPDMLRDLSANFMVVVRATVKGNVVVAMVQGALGGILFWILDIHAPVLWGVLMAFLSLLPAVGAALVWLPVGVYFLLTGAVGTGAFIIGYGIVVIGLVDNVLRPILVGKDTRMPDFIVLFSTLGGMAIFGFNGFVIGPVIAAMFIAIWEIFTRTHRKL